jgi:hypothetical protein
MSVNFTARLVYGLFVNKSDFKVIKKVRGCKHDIDEKDKYCSKCGSRAYVEKEYSLLDNGILDKSKLRFFRQSNYDEDDTVLFGFLLGEIDTCDSQLSEPVNDGTIEMKTEIEEFLKEYKIKSVGYNKVGMHLTYYYG